MDIYVLDQTFIPIAVIDSYKSLIWTTWYNACGDFELCMSASNDILTYIKIDNFIVRESDNASVMVIEKIEIETSIEDGDYLIISGRSVESLLDRRIIWNQTNIQNMEPSQAIFSLITDNVISPTNESRTITRFTLGSPLQTSDRMTAQFTGMNLLKAIETICNEYGIGFRVVLDNDRLMFSCYVGENTDVTFSSEFDNLIGSEYKTNMENYKNVALTAGEGEGTARKTAAVSNTSTEPTGIQRREMYVDARDLSTNDGEIAQEVYLEKLEQRGMEKLSDQAIQHTFSCEVAPEMTYQFKVDYNLGDIVTFENSYGITMHPRIVAVTESFSEAGYQVIPTFGDRGE